MARLAWLPRDADLPGTGVVSEEGWACWVSWPWSILTLRWTVWLLRKTWKGGDKQLPPPSHQTYGAAFSLPTHQPWGSIAVRSVWERLIAQVSSSLTHPSRGHALHWGLLTVARWKFQDLIFQDHWDSHLLWQFAPRNMERGKCYRGSFPESHGRHRCFLFCACLFVCLFVLSSGTWHWINPTFRPWHFMITCLCKAPLLFYLKFFLSLSSIPRHCCLPLSVPTLTYLTDILKYA